MLPSGAPSIKAGLLFFNGLREALGPRCPGPRRLYLCGSSCHHGGNITGRSGYNAAQVILADLDLAPKAR